MSNRKKLRGTRDGAARITPDKSFNGQFMGVYKLEVYDKKSDNWNTLKGCSNLTWGKAVIARANYVALRRACKIANDTVIRIVRPGIDEGERDERKGI
jgi:hypothetical protein